MANAQSSNVCSFGEGGGLLSKRDIARGRTGAFCPGGARGCPDTCPDIVYYFRSGDYCRSCVIRRLNETACPIRIL